MHCCSVETCGIGRFFSRFARRYQRRYRRKGLEQSQRQLIEGVERHIIGSSLLEIGCGVGYLHQSLLKAGAASALGIDLSGAMLAEAKRLAAEQGLGDRTEYREGDFVDLAESTPSADVTLLDKVVCCYPDAAALVRSSIAKTRRVYALTYPRDRAITRLGTALAAAILRLFGSRFRAYVHDPAAIESWISSAGFCKRYQKETFVWLTQVYVRA